MVVVPGGVVEIAGPEAGAVQAVLAVEVAGLCGLVVLQLPAELPIWAPAAIVREVSPPCLRQAASGSESVARRGRVIVPGWGSRSAFAAEV